jgi:hypothetical protein
MPSRSPASTARAIRLLEASQPTTLAGQELRAWYLAQLRQTPTWRSWPPQTPVQVRWPQVPARQLELRLEVAS